MKAQEKYKKLTSLGFNESGEWKLNRNELVLEINKVGRARQGNVLYAFIGNNHDILYVGKTIQGLVRRMNGYKNPGNSQPTNLRINDNIQKYLGLDKNIKIYSFFDQDNQTYKEFHINLVAGLEDSIIKNIKPSWNILGI